MTVCPACSFDFRPKQPKARSIPQHRRFFGMVRAAFQNWPDDHDFQPRDATECRKWLTAKAGFVDRRIIEAPPDLIAENQHTRRLAMLWMEQALDLVMSAHEYSWVRKWKDGFVVFIPKSVAFDSMGPDEFGMLNDRVSIEIERAIGVSGDDLLGRSKALA